MKTEFNVIEYWLERGRNYIDEKRTPPAFHRLQERFFFDVLRGSGVSMRRVLEIGCGFGRITKLLAETWADTDVTALDLSPEQLANARRYCGENPRVHFVQYDFYSDAPLPGRDYDAVVAIEVFLHHPPEFVVQLFKRLSGVASCILNIDWSEDWLEPLPVHVWVHDFAKLYAEAGLKCASFPLPEKVDGKQQKLFIASHDLSDEVKRLERSLRFATEPGCSAAVRDDSTEQLRLATDEALRIIPAGSQFILVDDGQWGNVRALGAHRVLPFLEKDGVYWGPPPDDATAWRELERLRRAGASYIAFAWPSFWWLEHFGEFARRLRGQFPCVLENERIVVFKLDI
jgi:SAM-dependent methyltransferase